jgi:hypothetical protein
MTLIFVCIVWNFSVFNNEAINESIYGLMSIFKYFYILITIEQHNMLHSICNFIIALKIQEEYLDFQIRQICPFVMDKFKCIFSGVSYVFCLNVHRVKIWNKQIMK